MAAIGDKNDLQAVIDAVFAGALKTTTQLESEGQLVGGPRYWAMSITENVKIELLKRGLFVTFEGPVDTQPSFAELAAKNRAEGGCGCAPGTVLCPH